MTNRFFSKLMEKVQANQKVPKQDVISVRVLLCHKSIWGSDSLVSALQDKNTLSQKYWIEKVDIVQYGRACLLNVINDTYDLIILDNGLENWPPAETVRKVREVAPNIRIILSTSVKTPEVLEMEANGMINSVLLAPFQAGHMWQVIDELLDK